MFAFKDRHRKRNVRGVATTAAALLAVATLASPIRSAFASASPSASAPASPSADAPLSGCLNLIACLAEARAHFQAGDAALVRAQAFSVGTSTTAPTSTTAAPTTTTVAPTTTTTVPTTTTAPTTTTTAVSTGGGPLGVPGTWIATFADEFNGPSLDRTKWNTNGSWECCDGGRSNLPNGELDYKTDGQNFSFNNGAITIQARRETAPNGQAWTSGQLGSKQAFTYGYVEQRGQFPIPKGFLDAFWTWGAPGTNASAQETDAYEFYSDNHGRVYLSAHTTGGGGCQGLPIGFDPTTGMHVYGTDIEPTGTDWYIDGVHVCHASGHPTQAWNIVDYMTVNSAARAPVADASTTHAEKIIDYIRVWTH